MVSGCQSRWNFGQLNKWDKAHLQVAETYAQLSTAKRRKVGCVIVKDNRIISIGYNGMPSGWDNECETNDNITKKEVLHAEANALTKVARSTESSEGAVLYCTCAPCIDCSKLIYQAGIVRVVYKDNYHSNEGLTFLEKCGILVQDGTEMKTNWVKC